MKQYIVLVQNKHLSLIKEARKMYSRNIIDLCEEDEALIKTHLGEFALYEGESSTFRFTYAK